MVSVWRRRLLNHPLRGKEKNRWKFVHCESVQWESDRFVAISLSTRCCRAASWQWSPCAYKCCDDLWLGKFNLELLDLYINGKVWKKLFFLIFLKTIYFIVTELVFGHHGLFGSTPFAATALRSNLAKFFTLMESNGRHLIRGGADRVVVFIYACMYYTGVLRIVISCVVSSLSVQNFFSHACCMTWRYVVYHLGQIFVWYCPTCIAYIYSIWGPKPSREYLINI